MIRSKNVLLRCPSISINLFDIQSNKFLHHVKHVSKCITILMFICTSQRPISKRAFLVYQILHDFNRALLCCHIGSRLIPDVVVLMQEFQDLKLVPERGNAADVFRGLNSFAMEVSDKREDTSSDCRFEHGLARFKSTAQEKLKSFNIIDVILEAIPFYLCPIEVGWVIRDPLPALNVVNCVRCVHD